MARRRQINKIKEPTAPAERYETIRKYIRATIHLSPILGHDPLPEFLDIAQPF